MVINNEFVRALNDLSYAWIDRWRINSIYRNPVHQVFHPPQSVLNGWHPYHCAADLQTFPAPRNTEADTAAALEFWNDLAALGKNLGFAIEPLALSGVGHVHVEIPCP